MWTCEHIFLNFQKHCTLYCHVMKTKLKQICGSELKSELAELGGDSMRSFITLKLTWQYLRLNRPIHHWIIGICSLNSCTQPPNGRSALLDSNCMFIALPIELGAQLVRLSCGQPTQYCVPNLC